MTQEQLATAADVPLGTLRDYEQGRRRLKPSFEITVRLARSLGTDCRAFAECVGEVQKPKARRRGRPAKK